MTSSSNGTGAVTAGSVCSCLQCRLTSIFQPIASLPHIDQVAEILEDLYQAIFGSIGNHCTKLEGICGRLEALTADLAGTSSGSRLKVITEDLRGLVVKGGDHGFR